MHCLRPDSLRPRKILFTGLATKILLPAGATRLSVPARRKLRPRPRVRPPIPNLFTRAFTCGTCYSGLAPVKRSPAEPPSRFDLRVREAGEIELGAEDGHRRAAHAHAAEVRRDRDVQRAAGQVHRCLGAGVEALFDARGRDGGARAGAAGERDATAALPDDEIDLRRPDRTGVRR